MVAFNFKKQFADDVETGRKFSTIREKIRCKPGDNVQLYTGMRTKNCRKLREDVCTGAGSILINRNKAGAPYWSIREIWGDLELGWNGLCLHEIEGFKNVEDFVRFFEDQYGLPFSGYIYQWKGNR